MILWQSLEPQLESINHTKERKKTFLYWLLLPLAILMLGLWFFIPSGKSEGTMLRPESKAKSEITTETQTKEQNTASGFNKEPNIAHNIDKEQKKSPDINKQTDLSEDQSSLLSLSKDQKSTSSASAISKTKSTRVYRKPPVETHQDFYTQKEKESAHVNASQNIPLNKQKQEETLPHQDNLSNLAIENTQKNQSNTNPSSSNSGDNTSQTIELLKIQAFRPAKLSRPHALTHTPEQWYRAEVPSDLDYVNDEGSKVNKPFDKAWRFNLGLIAGFSYTDKRLSARRESANGLLKLREITENSLETSHVGIELGLRHRSGWSIWSGIQQTRIVEHFEFDTARVEITTISGVRAIRINPGRDSTTILGNVPQTRTTTIQKSIFNNYELIDIPVFVGYEKRVGKINLGLQAGILVNLSLKTRGQILNQEAEALDIQQTQNTLFKSRVGLGYQFGARLSGPVVGGVDWMISPFLRVYPKDFAIESNNITQRYRVFGGKFGFLYRF